jgi:hypothetical protein
MMTMVISGSDGVTFPDSTTQNTTDRYGFVNRIINGNMVIDQRNAGAAVTVNDATQFFPVDRFFGLGQSADGVFTLQQSSTAPAGFTKSIIATVTTADASIGATQQYYISQRLEGFNTADFAWGTASAVAVTLSFWTRSSLTGTFGGALQNDAQDRSYPFTYTISAANTWEQKTINIAAITTGTWETTTNSGIRLYFDIGMGSTYLGTAGAWASADYRGATGQTNLIATSGATFYITGVQLEKGSTATPFERRPYGTELMLCQRYFEQYAGPLFFLTKSRESNRDRAANAFFKVTKRSSATITLVTSSADGGGAINAIGGIDGANFESLAAGDGNAPRVTVFNASAEL